MHVRSTRVFSTLLAFLWMSQPAHAGLWDTFTGLFQSKAPVETQSPMGPSVEELKYFPKLVDQLELLLANMVALHTLAEQTGMRLPEEGMLWKEILDGKVLRQYRAHKSLKVAVAGGTKAGKSTLFNHVAGKTISEVSHISGATKQTVLIVSKSRYDLPTLQLLNPGMELVTDATPEAATYDSGSVSRLLVRAVDGIPDDMTFSDMPDIDSDVQTNWEKAYKTARNSDVLIAVITPEKHGDQRILEFFRKVATEANKPIVVVVNKVQADQLERGDWADWLKVFCKGTGIKPISAYVAPYMQAADKGAVNFYQVESTFEGVTEGKGTFKLASAPSVLRDDLRKLNVDSLKAQAQEGALLQALQGPNGIWEYLNQVRRRSSIYSQAIKKYDDIAVSQKLDWPVPPGRILHEAVKKWWDENHRWSFTKTAKGWSDFASSLVFSRAKIEELKLKNARSEYSITEEDAIAVLIRSRMEAFRQIVQLPPPAFLTYESHELIQPETALLQAVKDNFRKERKMGDQVDSAATAVLPTWGKNHPLLMVLNHGADFAQHVIIRPTVTVSGVVAGVVAPEVIGAYVGASSAMGSVGGLASLGAGAGGGAITGNLSEKLAMGADANTASILFNEVGAQYAQERVAAINHWLRETHLAPLFAELERGANLVKSPEYVAAEQCMGLLSEWAKSRPNASQQVLKLSTD